MQDSAEQSSARTLTVSNVASFERCILELIANSLDARAAAIAVRIHAGRREIQVVDNGVGIPKDVLKRIAEYDSEAIGGSQAFEVGFASSLKQIEQRPSRGTTVSVYGFHETSLYKEWDMSTICFLIAAIAVTKLEVSFSIRDEDRKKVVLRIAKPHSPVEVLRTLFGKDLPLDHVWSVKCSVRECGASYHGYVGLSDKNAMQWIFLNHRPICCPLILRLIKVAFNERRDLVPDRQSDARDPCDTNMFILFFLTFPQKEFTFVTEGGRRYVMFYDMQRILSAIKNCAFKCLAEEAAVAAIPYLCKARMLRRMYLKSERYLFSNGRKDVTPSMIGKKVLTKGLIGLKRREVTSTIVTNCFNKRRREDYVENVKCCMNKRSNVLNSVRCRIASTKRTTSCGDKTVKKVQNGIDKTQGSSMNFGTTDNSTKSDESYTNHDNDNNNVTSNVISPLSEWSNWTYYTNNKKRDPARNVSYLFSKNDTRSRQFFQSQFDFLPRKLYGLLRRHVKLTNVKCFNSPNGTIPLLKYITDPVAENWLREQVAVHPCKLKQKLCEFRLSRASLKCIKIINQVNDEFIAAWMMYDKMKILLMIDQHAVHERIRYENLLLEHNVQNESELLSVNLRDSLSMEFPTEMCNLLLRNKTLLGKYGINLGSSKENTLLIRTVPQCLIINSDSCNSEKLFPRIYSLLNEVLKNRSITNQANALPLTIHNAIASEACHGAIKFGDTLTLEQCTSLIKLLKLTKFPNRCAHGRPTIIPVLEFSELEKRSARIPEKKLNFASLKRTASLE